MPNARTIGPILTLCVAALSACDRGDAAGLAPQLVRGTYALEAVTGRGATSGTLVLSADGTAERRVRYAQPGAGASDEYIARGTFQVGAGGDVALRLREDSGRSSYVWQPRAVLTGALLRLRYPDPADGPDIVESYRRQ